MPHHDDDAPPVDPADDERPEAIGRSILVDLGGRDRPGGGLQLADLDEEPPLPELRMGPEKYELVGELGRGGMGRVFEAVDHDLRRRVALKMIERSSPELVGRFVEEAQVMAQLDHPNIVPVFEIGVTERGRPYYTMRVVRGLSLAQVIKALADGDASRERDYSTTRLVQVLLQIGQGVAYAHDRGVLHRDLKPSNVMLGRHGEVQVMDWGLARVFRRGGVDTDDATRATSPGQVVGTPQFMAPEAVEGEELDVRADVYSLGVLLYEMLTLRRPFDGSVAKVMASVLRDPPLPPRQRAPERSIPLALEQVCLRALAKDRDQRYPDVQAMMDDVQGWLEAEADRERRRQLAAARAAEARDRLAEYQRQLGVVEEARGLAAAAAASVKSWQPEDQKEALIAAEDHLQEARDRLVHVAAEVVATAEKALAFEDTNALARECLADYYWSRLESAEARGAGEDAKFFAERVAVFHDGKYARQLGGAGRLSLRSEPSPATVRLHRFERERLRLVAQPVRELGETPLADVPLEHGSYLLELTGADERRALYPIVVGRRGDWDGSVRLLRSDEIGAGLVHIPGGPYLQGGDPAAANPAGRSEQQLDDFSIARFPVTMAEYVEFVNAIAESDGLEAARARAPRPGPDAPCYLVEDGNGRLVLPEVDPDGDRWEARWPAFGVTWHDASAYAAWRSQTDGRPYRLPSEGEWEKAARGVDGRLYPWGDRFDPCLCNVQSSRRDRAAPVVVDEFPGDVSVYGVRGLAGNVWEWTSSEHDLGEGAAARVARVVRGGGWGGNPVAARAASRFWIEPDEVQDFLGFRLVTTSPA